jgi:hypothetical protein
MTTPKKRIKKDVHALVWELFDAIEEVQTWWNAQEEQAKFDRKVAKIRKQYERLTR